MKSNEAACIAVVCGAGEKIHPELFPPSVLVDPAYQVNVPGVASYPGSTGYKINFRCDKDYHLRSKIERELFRTFDDATSSGQYSIPGQDSVLSLVLTNKQNLAIRQYNLYGCYVQAIDDEAYDIKDVGNVVSINTTIAYQYWKVVIPAAGFQQVTPRDSAGN